MNDTVNRTKSESEVQNTRNDSSSTVQNTIKTEDPSPADWHQIRNLSPFVKKSFDVGSEGARKTLTIRSKNAMSKETSEWLTEAVQGKEVLLSHSSSNGQSSRGVVLAVEYLLTRIEVTVYSEEEMSIWEDTDVWILPVHFELADTVPTPSVENVVKREMTQRDVFERINGWKYTSGVYQRFRKKYGTKWKNVYKSHMTMTPLREDDTAFLALIEDRVALKLSEDIDESGDLLVEVCNNNREENSITLGVTGFQRRDVDIIFSKDTTYYLSVDDQDDDDVVSLGSEDDVLPGYKLVPDVDELCEKIGELSMTDVCVKTWFAKPSNMPFIRLVLTNHTKRKLLFFKALVGYHIVLRNVAREKEEVLAVVNKVLKDEMIVTLKGFPRCGKHTLFSKEERFTIHIDHEFEERTRQFKGADGNLEGIRRDTIEDSDIRLLHKWKSESIPPKKYAKFGYKNPAIGRVPFGTKVLLGKCWEVEGVLEKKAEFIFAVRVASPKSYDNTIVFELKYTKSLIEDATESFQVSKAFYFLEFDFSSSISLDPTYGLYDARCCSRSNLAETVRSSHPISSRRTFQVIDCGPKFNRNRAEWRNTSKEPRRVAPVLQNLNIELTELLSQPVDESRKSSEPSSPESGFIDEQKSFQSCRPMITKQKRLCFAYLLQHLPSGSENNDPIVQLRVGFDENGVKMKMKRPLNIGDMVVLTEGSEHKEIKLCGDVQDTSGEKVELKVVSEKSDLDFLRSWKTTDPLPLFEDR